MFVLLDFKSHFACGKLSVHRNRVNGKNIFTINQQDFMKQLRPTHIFNDVDEITVEKWKFRPIVDQTYTAPYNVVLE